MRILLLGHPLFRHHFRRMGLEVLSVGPEEEHDIRVDTPNYELAPLLDNLGDQQPDLILYSESLRHRSFPLDLDRIEIPRVFHAVDIHLHYNWQRDFARLFDHVAVSQKDYVYRLQQDGIQQVSWLPYAVEPVPAVPDQQERIWDITMVGSFDPQKRLKRNHLIRQISGRFRIKLFGPPYTEWLSADEMQEVYRRSRIVFNETIGGELNFRLWEGMNNGALVMTEETGNGLDDLFIDGRHLVTYTERNLYQRLQYYLRHDEERLRIAEQGMREVQRNHTAQVRAQQMWELMQHVVSESYHPGARMYMGKTLFKAHLRHVNKDPHAQEIALRLISESREGALFPEATYLNQAVVQCQMGDTDDAVRSMEKALSINAHSYHYHFVAANLYLKQNQLQEAGKEFERGVNLANMDSLDEELTLLQLIDQQQYDSEFYRLVGNLYERNGRGLEEGILGNSETPLPLYAVHYYKLSLDLDNHNEKALLDLGRLFYHHRIYDWASISLRSLVEISPFHVEGLRLAGHTLIHNYQRHDGIRYLARAFTIEHDDGFLNELAAEDWTPDEWSWFWAEVAIEEDHPEEAITHLRAAIDRGDQVETYMMRLGTLLFDHSEWESARKLFREYCKRVPYSGEGYAMQAFTYIQLKYTDLALWHLERSLRHDPNNQLVKQVYNQLRHEQEAE